MLATLLLASTINGVANDGSNRVWIVGLTNRSVLSGLVQLPIQFAATNQDIVGIAVYGTNGPIIGAHAFSIAEYRYWMSRYGTNGPIPADTNNGDWFLNWDTQMSGNGDYAVIAELDFDGTNEPVVSQPVSVTVSNLFSFPNELSMTFGTRMWIYFQTLPGAKVQIDMYGQGTNYLGSFHPTSDTNGVVSFLWDLTDGNGYRFKDTSFSGVFTLETMPAASHKVSQPNLRINSMPPYMLLQKFKTANANAAYQVVCRWNGRHEHNSLSKCHSGQPIASADLRLTSECQNVSVRRSASIDKIVSVVA